MVKNLKVLCVKTINGEKHYVVRSLKGNESFAESEDFDEAKIRRIMRKEASRPLLLVRAE